MMNPKIEAKIVQDIATKFRTFGGGRTDGASFNPLVMALKDAPLQFAAGVDVAEVVSFVLQRQFTHRYLPVEEKV